jgi:hypothetical protein
MRLMLNNRERPTMYILKPLGSHLEERWLVSDGDGKWWNVRTEWRRGS